MTLSTRPTRERRLPSYLENNYILDVDFRKNYKKTLLKEQKKAERLAKQLEKAKARKEEKIKAARKVETVVKAKPTITYSPSVFSSSAFSTPFRGTAITTTSTTTARNIRNELIVGNACADKWAISKCSSSNLNRFLSSCKYHPGKIHNPEHRPTVEIVFTFDTTGSMYSAISELKQKLEALVSQLLNDLPGIRIAIIAHGDYCDVGRYDVVTKLDFSNDLDTLVQFVKAVPSTGGGDAPEAYELALKECSVLNWYKSTPDATEYDDNISRVVVMIGDDVPHKPTEHYHIDWRQELKNLHEQLLVKVYGVQCLGRSYADSFYQELADATYGTRLELAKFSHMHELILGLCYRESAEHASVQFANKNNSSTVPGSDSMANSTETVASTLTDEEMMQIHRAIHDSTQRSVNIRGVSYEISVNPAECRFVRVLDIVYIEQNKTKNTKYAIMAREGAKVTWITHKGAWGLIVNDECIRR